MKLVKKRIVAFLLCFIVLTTTSTAERILLQAETYTDYHEIGFDPIHAGSGYLLGLDYPGEWTEYEISNVYTLGTRRIGMNVLGQANVLYHLQVTVIPSNMATSETINVVFLGKGVES